VGFLLIFIPLYPKIPLAEIIPGYIVKVRLEDLFIFITGLVWLVQLFRKKIQLNTIFFRIIIGYGIVGIFSILSGMFLLGTIPFEMLHIGKSGLHFFRYLEYFSLFIFGFSGIKTKAQLKKIGWLISISVLAIFIYGVGQKYFAWPVFSTMNREFSKGVALQLGERARVQSTFGGHYDMAAYLVVILPILFAFTLKFKNILLRLGLVAIQGGGVWLLLVGASKTSLISYLIANLVVLSLYLKKQQKIKKKLFKISLILIPVFLLFLAATFIISPKMANKFVSLGRKVPLAGRVIDKISPPSKQALTEPDDLYINQIIYHERTVILPSGEKQIELTEKELTWSKNAMKYGVSMGIRFDTLWPQAITGLRRNIFLGASFANLNKRGLREFTESDSTDNNYLRVLGEIGLVGFVVFYGLIFLILKTIAKIKTKDVYTGALKIGFLGASLGLLINAFYIDVFAASKVAFIFWGLAGVILKSFYLENKPLATALDKSRFNFFKINLKKIWPAILGFIIFALLLYRNPYMEQKSLTVKLNFTSNQYKYLTLAKCIAQENSWSLCREGRATPAGITPLYSLTLAPIYKVLHNPHAFYFVNFILATLSFIFFYLILKIIFGKSQLKILLMLLIYGFNPYLRALVFTSSPLNLTLFLLILAGWSILRYQNHLHKNIPQLKVNIAKLTKLTNKKQFFNPFILGLATLTLALFIIHPDPLLKDFSESEKVGSYRTIFRANSILDTKLKDPPLLITALNPFVVDYYSNHNYQLLPFSKQQDLFSQNKTVWGNYDYTNLTNLYKSLLDQSKQLFFTNYLVDDFKNLRKNFKTTVIILDCAEKCNFYRLSSLTSLPDIIQPTTHNQRKIKQTANFNFLVLGHSYQDTRRRFPPYSTPYLVANLQPLINKPANFMIFMGDLLDEHTLKNLVNFDNAFANRLPYPLINVKDNSHELLSAPDAQTYKVGQNYFINLNFPSNHRLTNEEKMCLYNIIFELENSDVKNIFIFNYENLRENTTFIKFIEPRFKKLIGKKIYFVSNPIIGKTVPQDIFTQAKKDNFVYITTGFGDTTSKHVLNFQIDQGGKVKIEKISL